MKSSAKFSIPDYTACKKSEINKKNNSRFHVYRELKTFKDKPKYSIATTFSKGWGLTRFSIPKIKEGIRKTSARMSVPNDFNISPPGKTRFELPKLSSKNLLDDDDVDKHVSNNSRFSIPDPEKLINRTRNVSIAKCRDGPFNRFISGNFRDYTKDSYLINNKRFNLSTCSVTNLILRHEFNELEICSSQISLWFVTSLTLLSFIIDIFTFYPPHVTSSTYTLSTPYSLQIGFLFY